MKMGTSNIQHRTPNVERRTSNVERRIGNGGTASGEGRCPIRRVGEVREVHGSVQRPVFGSHVVEQILLGVAGVGAEVGFGKMLQAFAFGAAAREVKFLQGFHDPHIYRKGGLEPIRKEEDAIGDFAADAGEFQELVAREFDGQLADPVQIDFSFGDEARRFEQVRGTETHFAGAQFGFGGAREARGGREGEGGCVFGRGVNGIAEAFTEQPDDLTDLDDLFGGRQDERGEAFPRVLAQQAQAAAGGHGGAHGFVVGKRHRDSGEVQVELQVMSEPVPVRCGFRCFGSEREIVGAQADPVVTDDAVPAAVDKIPAECLAGFERGREVVVANLERGRSCAALSASCGTRRVR